MAISVVQAAPAGLAAAGGEAAAGSSGHRHSPGTPGTAPMFPQLHAALQRVAGAAPPALNKPSPRQTVAAVRRWAAWCCSPAYAVVKQVPRAARRPEGPRFSGAHHALLAALLPSIPDARLLSRPAAQFVINYSVGRHRDTFSNKIGVRSWREKRWAWVWKTLQSCGTLLRFRTPPVHQPTKPLPRLPLVYTCGRRQKPNLNAPTCTMTWQDSCLTASRATGAWRSRAQSCISLRALHASQHAADQPSITHAHLSARAAVPLRALRGRGRTLSEAIAWAATLQNATQTLPHSRHSGEGTPAQRLAIVRSSLHTFSITYFSPRVLTRAPSRYRALLWPPPPPPPSPQALSTGGLPLPLLVPLGSACDWMVAGAR